MNRFMVSMALLVCSLPASAQWVAGGGYLDLSDDVGNDNLRLGVIFASIGYMIELDGPFFVIPELRLGSGVSDDNLSGFGTDVELDYFAALGIRGQYEFDSGLLIFANPSYGRIKLSASFGPGSLSESESEFGFGGGAGYRFSENAWGELALERFDGTDVLSIGFRVAF